MKKLELKQIIQEEIFKIINNETFRIPNENTMEFEEFLREFNLLQNVINTNQKDFYTDYMFNDLTEEEINWIEDEENKYI